MRDEMDCENYESLTGWSDDEDEIFKTASVTTPADVDVPTISKKTKRKNDNKITQNLVSVAHQHFARRRSTSRIQSECRNLALSTIYHLASDDLGLDKFLSPSISTPTLSAPSQVESFQAQAYQKSGNGLQRGVLAELAPIPGRIAVDIIGHGPQTRGVLDETKPVVAPPENHPVSTRLLGVSSELIRVPEELDQVPLVPSHKNWLQVPQKQSQNVYQPWSTRLPSSYIAHPANRKLPAIVSDQDSIKLCRNDKSAGVSQRRGTRRQPMSRQSIATTHEKLAELLHGVQDGILQNGRRIQKLDLAHLDSLPAYLSHPLSAPRRSFNLGVRANDGQERVDDPCDGLVEILKQFRVADSTVKR